MAAILIVEDEASYKKWFEDTAKRSGATVGRKVVGAQPVFTQDDGVHRQATDVLDEACEVEGDLRIGRLIGCISRLDRSRFAETIDLDHPRRNRPLRRLPCESSGKTRGERQAGKGHQAPILGLDACRADPLIPDLGGFLIGRNRLWGAAVMDSRAFKHA